MNYTTYISAAEKLITFGQKSKANSFIEHANKIEERKISELKFNILVGEVKAFEDAKFIEARVLREKESNTIMFIFKSGNDNTHRINTTINKDGSVKWQSGNLFLDRYSVKNFDKLLRHITNYQKDIISVITAMSIGKEAINLVNRTFYI
jgi:hypothetical protein